MQLDLLIRGGTVVDGTGRPGFPGDVGVRGDRIVAVGVVPADAPAAHVIDASRRVVAPGFVDVHVHSETALIGTEDRNGALLQGVTTHFTGADGFGWAPLPAAAGRELWRALCFAYGDRDRQVDWPTVESYLDGFTDRTPINVVPMAPHQAIRFAVMGWDDRPAGAPELARMADVTRQWMDAGAAGLNTGLDYPPAAASTTDELVALARVAGEYGGVYAAHQRYQGAGRIGGYRESIEIGRRAGVPVRISHESLDDETEPIVDEARRDLDVTVDWYLYPAGSSHLMVMLPPEEQAGGPEGLVERLRADPEQRRRLAALFEKRFAEEAVARGGREYFANTRTGRWIGRSVSEVAAEMGRTVGEAAVELLIEESPDAILVFMRGTPPDQFEALARRTIQHPAFTVASDGFYHGALPHPRGYGCFVRVLGLFGRELCAIGLEEAVRKMSALPAERFGITDRGRVAEGCAADLVVFDPLTVGDRATWEKPRATAVGIDTVVVNGTLAVEGGRPTGALSGRVVRKGGR